jgi:hypothetical protein
MLTILQVRSTIYMCVHFPVTLPCMDVIGELIYTFALCLYNKPALLLRRAFTMKYSICSMRIDN